jgi:protein AroM
MMTTHSKWPLETVLRGGRAVTVPKEEIEPRLSACAGHLVDQGATVVVLACTAEFHHLRCAVPVIYPSQVVAGVVEALAVTRRLGVVSPSPQQQHVLRERWRERGFDVSIVSAAPCRTNELEQAAAELRTQEVEAVVLDCMGYDATWHRRFALQVGLPVVNPRTIVAAVVSAVVAGFPLSRVLGGAVRG